MVKLYNSLPHNPKFQRTLGKKPFENLVEKEKMLVTSILSLSYNVSDQIGMKIITLATFNLSSGNALDSVQSKKLLFGKELTETVCGRFRLIYQNKHYLVIVNTTDNILISMLRCKRLYNNCESTQTSN